eukprot:1963962-Pyramimonas_sp.AAC.1
MPLRSLIFLLRAAALQRSMALGRPHRHPSDGGRRAPRPLALAQTGRTLRFCQQARGNLHSFSQAPAVRARGRGKPGCAAAANS